MFVSRFERFRCSIIQDGLSANKKIFNDISVYSYENYFFSNRLRILIF